MPEKHWNRTKRRAFESKKGEHGRPPICKHGYVFRDCIHNCVRGE